MCGSIALLSRGLRAHDACCDDDRQSPREASTLDARFPPVFSGTAKPSRIQDIQARAFPIREHSLQFVVFMSKLAMGAIDAKAQPWRSVCAHTLSGA